MEESGDQSLLEESTEETMKETETEEENGGIISIDNEIETLNDEAEENNAVKINKLLKLPFSKIKQIMKSDPDCTIVQQDAVFLVTKATELFLEFMTKEVCKNLMATKRKTMSRQDVDTTIRNVEHCFFLEGVFEKQ